MPVLFCCSIFVWCNTGSAAEWTGNSFFTNNWSAIDNWFAFNVANGSSEDALLPGNLFARTRPNLDINVSLRNLTFSDAGLINAPAYTLGGSGRIDIYGGISNHSNSSQTINNPVRTRSDNLVLFSTSFSNDVAGRGNLTFNGTVTLDAPLTGVVAGLNGISFNGAIAGGGGLQVVGPGTTTLAASNSFTGDLTVEGRVRVTGRGRIANQVDVNVLESGWFRVEVPDAINGLYGAGEVQLATNAFLAVGNYAGFNARGDGNFVGQINGPGQLSKRGVDGRFVLGGINSYAGGTLVEEGILAVYGEESGTGSGDTEVFSGATLEGSGVLASETIVNEGAILRPAPRGSSLSEDIAFGFEDLTLLDGAITKLEIANLRSAPLNFVHASVDVAGTANLDGVLELTKTLTQLPDGERLRIFDAGQIVGEFDRVDGVMLNDARSLAIVYSDTFIDAVVAIPGDTNLDGAVNFADFLTLSSNFGTGSIWTEGDFDGNGMVEFPDFLNLSRNFGESTAVAVPVPEPKSGFLLLIAFVVAAVRRRSSPPAPSWTNQC